MLLIHIVGATLGLISGALAMLFRKGSGWHAVAGNVFFGSMLGMTSSAIYMAIFVKPIMINVVAGMLTMYLVTTGWRTARNRDGHTGAFDVVAMLVGLSAASAALMFGFQAASSPTGMKDKVPAAVYFIFGSVALMFASSDVRMLLRGPVAGGRRIARHLLRMCFALLIATFSFFPGQARLFPTPIRRMTILYTPHILLVGAMLFWTVRLLARKRSGARTAPFAFSQPR